MSVMVLNYFYFKNKYILKQSIKCRKYFIETSRTVKEALFDHLVIYMGIYCPRYALCEVCGVDLLRDDHSLVLLLLKDTSKYFHSDLTLTLVFELTVHRKNFWLTEV